jgi:cytochrome c oxidase subunit 2
MILATQDVIHSFFVPAFRIKQDVVPGRYTSTWFKATQVGRFHLFCAEYCGLDHARMGGQVVVMEPAAYQNWLSGGVSPAAQGEKLFSTYGCVACHGSASIAPSLNGVYGSRVALQSGERVAADETYLRDSILSPSLQVVAGYSPIMPSFAGRIGEQDLLNLIAYIKSLAAKEKKHE